MTIMIELLGEGINAGVVQEIIPKFDPVTNSELGTVFKVKSGLWIFGKNYTLPLSTKANPDPYFRSDLIMWDALPPEQIYKLMHEDRKVKLYIKADRFGNPVKNLTDIDSLKEQLWQMQFMLDAAVANKKMVLEMLRDREVDAWEMEKRIIKHADEIGRGKRFHEPLLPYYGDYEDYSIEGEGIYRDPFTGKFVRSRGRGSSKAMLRDEILRILSAYPTEEILMKRKELLQKPVRKEIPSFEGVDMYEESEVQPQGEEERKRSWRSYLSSIKNKIVG